MNIYEKLKEFDEEIASCDDKSLEIKNKRIEIVQKRKDFIAENKLKAGSVTLSFSYSGDFTVKENSTYNRCSTIKIYPDNINEFLDAMKRFFDNDPSLSKKRKKSSSKSSKKESDEKDNFRYIDLDDK